MLENKQIKPPQGLRKKINDAYHMDERTLITELMKCAELQDESLEHIKKRASIFIEQIRDKKSSGSGIDSFLTEYTLSTEEGIALMCLAEAFLRIPDKATLDSLIKDKLISKNWTSHKGQSQSFYVNATTWGLILTGKILKPANAENLLSKALNRFVNRSSETLIRKAIQQAMLIMSRQFVMGRSIKEAMGRAQKMEVKGYRYSYDMLGEAAMTADDARRYFKAYMDAVDSIGSYKESEDMYKRPGISVKLSALYPRYFEQQHQAALKVLSERLLCLCQKAKEKNISLTVDAEEAERLDLSLDIFEKVFKDPSLNGWEGMGLALQSYQKRAYFVIDWLAELASSANRRIMLRLIKGAYWDTEIKNAQVQAMPDYPVFTRKAFTDVSFQACAKKILSMTHVFYPQFATHNASSVAMVLELAKEYRDFEFQCLHGMGAELYEQIVPQDKLNIPCRIYAPVGSHKDLLPYLVRRLLENGANSSFVNRIVDSHTDISELVCCPVEKAHKLLPLLNQNIPLPADIFMPMRKNSKSLDLSDRQVRAELQERLNQFKIGEWSALPTNAAQQERSWLMIYAPFAYSKLVGRVSEACETDIENALSASSKEFKRWSKTSVETRASCIERAASLIEDNYNELMALACLEAGKTWPDAVAEVREAVDFCRYYAHMARSLQSNPTSLPGYTGEVNQLSYHPRGTVLCISPWNFPLAIFTGQVVAALVTGNTVIAKPAEQTPLIAAFMVNLLLKAGIPEGVVQLLPGPGETVAAALVKDLRVKAVMFTGSTDTASLINQNLAQRPGEIIPLIAETGGQNAMIVDSSALLEQVVQDVVVSAFGSAGQRCSALRVLYVQDEIYPEFVQMLKGAMAELNVGDPSLYKTDVGPVIDKEAMDNILNHIQRMSETYNIIYQCELNEAIQEGSFVPPTAIAIDSIRSLSKEVFGPVLHIVSYKRSELDKIIEDINSTEYGLTFGMHSRINDTVCYIQDRIHAGNCYVNRNMTGAIVGLQPFGGEGLSGTGPKAGGPNYLRRLCHERVYTENTTAAGGNASLMSLSDELII